MPARGSEIARAPELVVVFATRERVRTAARAAVPRHHGRVVLTRTVPDFRAALRATVVDAAIVDLGAPGDVASDASAMARELPSVAFIGLSPFRAADAPRIASCATLDFVDVLADGIDDELLRPRVATCGFSSRFAVALRDPPAALALSSPLRLAAWRAMCGHAGRPVRSASLASWLGVTREHLSRSFSSGGATSLKRTMDLVRVLAAAELAKNPGYGISDVARLLGFASPAHLSRAASRVAGTTADSLAGLRAVDLITRFARGRERARA